MASRMVRSKTGSASSSVVKIAVAAVSLSVAVMVISMAIIIGFKNEIMEKVVGFGSTINIVNRESAANYETFPVDGCQNFFPSIENEDGISHIQRYAAKPAILKSGVEICGVILKGVGSEYDWSFFEKNLVEGKVFKTNDSIKNNNVVISKKIADMLNLKIGDNLAAYFIQNPPRMRKYVVSGIYQTGLEEYDKLFCIVDLLDIQKLNNWQDGKVTGFEVMIDDFGKLDEMTSVVRDYAGYQIAEDGSMLRVQNVKDTNRQLFDWLTLTEMNVWVVLSIMFFVALVNMSTAMLIIIFERTAMIGIMKSIGARNWLIRKIFIIQSLYITGKGILIGNVVALVLIFIQQKFNLIGLDPTSYYVDHVPVSLHFWYFLAIDFATMVVMGFMLVFPSFVISKMQPAKVVGFK